MALKQQIQKDLADAMRAKDTLRISALRMLKAAILKFEVSGERKEASDNDILTLVNKEIKQRRDSIEQFKIANRFEQAEQEQKEIEVLKSYMPPQLTEEEILKFAQESIAESGAHSRADIGKVMNVLMPKLKGLADGNVVNKIVSALLA